MTEQRTITESDLQRKVDRMNGGLSLRNVLLDLGITVVPDPAPPLPTEPGWYVSQGDILWRLDADGKWRDGDGLALLTDTPLRGRAPFERLETRAEGDARVLAALDEYHPLGAFWRAEIARVLRDARKKSR